MVAPLTVAFAASFVGLLVGVGVVLTLLSDDVGTGGGAFEYLLVIPGFAAIAYLLMTLGIGTVTVAGNEILLPRYVDWLVTTPILVGYVGHVAGAPRKWIGAVAAADALMIVTGAVATVLDPPLKWGLFGMSALFHLALFVVIYRVFPRYVAASNERWGLFKLLQNHIGLLWIAYPVVWLASPAGFDVVSAVGIGLVVAYLDVIAKTPYVYFVWSRRHAFAADADDGAATSPPTVAD